MNPTKTTKKGVARFSLFHEILNAISHGVGSALAIAGTVLLFIKSAHVETGSKYTFAALLIYAITLNLFLLSSTLFHALIFTKAARVFQRLDHTAIFLVIIGTYTPFLWIFMNNQVGWTTWWIIFALTVIGILYDTLATKQRRWFLTLIYLLLGWIIVFDFPILIKSIPPLSVWLLIIGGVAYSIGTIFYMVKKIPLNHFWWHLLVLAGTILMYFSIYVAL